VDLSKINTGEKIIGGSGIALLIFSFFPWLGFSYGPFSSSGSAWKFTLCWFAVILGVLMAAYVIAKLFDVNVPDLGNIPWSQILLGVAALAFLLILIKLIVGPGTGGVDISGTGVSKERKIGIFLGLIAAAGLVAGAYLNAASRGELPWGNKGKSAPPAA
jgi:uncharacterized membrane protein